MHARGLSLKVLCAAILAALVAGCGGPAAGGKPADAAGSGAKVLKWGADSSGGAPYVFNDPKNADKVIGFEMEIMDKLAEHMGVKHERVQAEWANLLENMKAKRTDCVINGIEINE